MSAVRTQGRYCLLMAAEQPSKRTAQTGKFMSEIIRWWSDPDYANVLVGALAMLVSVIALLISWRASKKGSVAQERSAGALEESAEAHHLAVQALKVGNELRQQLVELERLKVPKQD